MSGFEPGEVARSPAGRTGAMAHLTALRINAVELLRSPGASRSIEVSVPAGALGVDDPRVDGDVDVALVATSSVDGIGVRGTLAVEWHDQCRRCLVDVTGVATAEVHEVFQHEPRLDDAVEIVGDQIDLAPIVREYVLLELPEAPLCRDDCAGICPQCGADRNESSCGCDTELRDPRWAALEGLQLDDPPA
jgi:uncharacterized protein